MIYHNCGNNTIDMIESILRVGAAGYHFGNSIDMKTMLGKIPTDIPVMGNVDPAVQFRNRTPNPSGRETLRIMEACCPEYPNYHLLRLRYSARHALDEYRRVFAAVANTTRDNSRDREARATDTARRAFCRAPSRPTRGANGSGGVSAQSQYTPGGVRSVPVEKEGQAGKPPVNRYTIYAARSGELSRLEPP